jgi:hypothetical protein
VTSLIEASEPRSAPDPVPLAAFAAFACSVVGWSSLLLLIGRYPQDTLYAVGLVIFVVGIVLGGALGWHAARHRGRSPGGWMAAVALASVFTVAGVALVQLIIGAIGAAS